MKTLAGWILGVFALGLVVGGVFDGTSAEEDGSGSAAGLLANLPAVDCGFGREAVLAPTYAGGQTSLTVRCVDTDVALDAQPEWRGATRSFTPAPAQAPAPAPVYVVAPAPAPVASSNRSEPVVETNRENQSSRDWKDSALVIGGAAGAGAGIGAIAKGGKGAAVGAAIGGVAGTVYELARKKH